MDPVNLSGTRNTPSDCQSHAGIRTPAGCACCGFKDYPQNLPQAYCFTALCPGLSKCKSPQDHPQDSFAIPHPFFSSFPFQQHVFHSSIIPPNFCCSQKPLGEEGTNPSQTQSRNEHKINQHQTDHGLPPQKEKPNVAETNRNTNEEPQKNNPLSSSETNLPYTNSTDSQPNTVFQRCVCGDSLPWACSPFIVPVLSYCFLWNSQTTTPGLLPKTYNSYITETLCQKNSKKQANQKYSCTSDCQEQQHTLNQEPEKATCDNNHDPVEISQESLEVNKLSKTELKTEEHEEGTEQEENECIKNDSDVNYEEEEDESETGDDCEIRDQTESEESLKVDENDNSAPDSSENLSKDLEYHGYPDTESSTNLKSPPKSSEHSLNDALSENTGNISVTEIKDMNPLIASNEDSEEKNSDFEDTDTCKTYSKEMVIKKCIKNFTVTDKINGAPSKEMQMSAAGDLGGESCDGCKIRISLRENNEEISKELFKKGVAKKESETKVPLEGRRKKVEEIRSSGYKFKSGIAKLSHNSNLKAPKSTTLKATKKCKIYSYEKQSNPVRFKHCCFPTENTNSKSESLSKILKAKKCTVLQNPAPGKSSGAPGTEVSLKPKGPEIQKKLLHTRQTLKKEHTLRRPARPVNLSDNSQKAVKTLLGK